MTDKAEPSARTELLLALDGERPLGAGAAREVLLEAGIDLSEATAGRLLRDLEREGLAVKIGVQGRRLTEEGQRAVAEIRRHRTNEASTEALLDSLRTTKKKELVDLIVTRRALEAEAARLAASNGTPEEIEELRSVMAETKRLIASGRSMAGSDGRFHATIAAMARNPILEAALQLIWHNGQYSPLLEVIRYRLGRTLGGDHERILQAIADGDGDGARQAMADHLDNVLRDVEALEE
ncbi:MAG: FCD domain-containing protein [Synergistaceae bacterium]|nr:FCD domain-containing protein [Synergistaceae bacterium]